MIEVKSVVLKYVLKFLTHLKRKNGVFTNEMRACTNGGEGAVI